MLQIDEIKINGLKEGCVTDGDAPRLAFSLKSEKQGTELASAVVRVGGREFITSEQCGIALKGLTLKPFTRYEVSVTATDNFGSLSEGKTHFRTGRRELPWTAKWITNASYTFPKNASPAPFTFRKAFAAKKIKRALLTATALGIYELEFNGKKVGEQYFAPGFTSYKHILQYDLYDVTALLKEQNELVAVVGGGWAVGRFTYSSKSRITCDRQAFLAELFLEYEDGSKEKIVTDESWQQTMDGNFRFGDFYDGEVYDATLDLNQAKWRAADIYRPKIKPQITARYGCRVIAHERLKPLSHFPAKNGKEEIYDFGQNFAGVVSLHIKGKKGQKVTVRHAEIVTDGDFNVKSLRTAKATLVYTCKEGEQEYSPRLTYMGFRYIGVSGIAPENIEVFALALYSDFEETGSFECSDRAISYGAERAILSISPPTVRSATNEWAGQAIYPSLQRRRAITSTLLLSLKSGFMTCARSKGMAAGFRSSCPSRALRLLPSQQRAGQTASSSCRGRNIWRAGIRSFFAPCIPP